MYTKSTVYVLCVYESIWWTKLESTLGATSQAHNNF